jgi:adenosylcobinamide-phosphate synthase
MPDLPLPAPWLSADTALRLVTALALAWALDRAFGEPPNRWHPVAWLGSALAPLTRQLPRLAPRPALWAGGLAWCAVVGTVTVLAWALQIWLLSLPAWWGVPLLALVLKPSFAWRMLHDEVATVGQRLHSEGLAGAREQLARLCSRDVHNLGDNEVLETAIETLAENFNDALVAPLWWCLLAGLPGAWAWRATNTLDAMWGYRGRWDHAGRWAAQADDVGAWVPARLSAGLLLPRGHQRLASQARLTPSPNGGWPMAAMALHLGVRLRKPGVYTLNATAPSPSPAHLQKALAHGQRAATAAFAMAMLCLGLMAVYAP